jgi:hypothetical protein
MRNRKLFVSLIALVAMLSVVAIPAFAGAPPEPAAPEIVTIVVGTTEDVGVASVPSDSGEAPSFEAYVYENLVWVHVQNKSPRSFRYDLVFLSGNVLTKAVENKYIPAAYENRYGDIIVADQYLPPLQWEGKVNAGDRVVGVLASRKKGEEYGVDGMRWTETTVQPAQSHETWPSWPPITIRRSLVPVTPPKMPVPIIPITPE